MVSFITDTSENGFLLYYLENAISAGSNEWIEYWV